MREEFQNHVGGAWVASVGRKTFENRNPAEHRDLVGRFQASTAADAHGAVEAAAAAFAAWCKTPIGTSTFRESGRVGLEFYTQVKTVYQGCA